MMKKKLYLTFFLLVSFFLVSIAQNVEKTFRPAFFSTPNFMISFSDNKILIGGEGKNDFNSKEIPFLVMLDTLGNILWQRDIKQDFPNNNRRAVKDIFLENDHIYVEVYVAPWCDTGGGHSQILKLDSIGQSIEIIPYVNFPKIKYGDLYSAMDLYNFHILDSTFQTVHSEPLIQPNNYLHVTDIDYLEPFFLASTENSSTPCGLITLDIEHIYQNFYSVFTECLDFGDIQVIEKSDNGNIFLQNNNRILLINENFEVTNELVLSDSLAISNFQVDNNKLIVFCDSLSFKSIKIYDESFNFLHEVIFEEELKLFPKYAFLQNNKLYVTGEEHSKHHIIHGNIHIEKDSRSSIFFRSYNLDTVNVFPFHDIGISQVSIADAPIISPPNNCNYYEISECGNSTKNIEYKNIYVVISNYGNYILNECTVNARTQQCGNCSYFCTRTFTYSEKYENLNILPGETKEVLFGDIKAEDQQITTTHNLCLWTANPNNLIDKNIENDQHCIDSEVTTDVLNLKESAFEFHLFPNPSNSSEVNFHIDFEKEEKEVFIHDAIGNQMATYHLDENLTNLKIDTSDFPKGIYIVSVKTGGVTSAKKLMLH